MKKKLLKVLSTLLISCNLFVVPASANTRNDGLNEIL